MLFRKAFQPWAFLSLKKAEICFFITVFDYLTDKKYFTHLTLFCQAISLDKRKKLRQVTTYRSLNFLLRIIQFLLCVFVFISNVFLNDYFKLQTSLRLVFFVFYIFILFTACFQASRHSFCFWQHFNHFFRLNISSLLSETHKFIYTYACSFTAIYI